MYGHLPAIRGLGSVVDVRFVVVNSSYGLRACPSTNTHTRQ